MKGLIYSTLIFQQKKNFTLQSFRFYQFILFLMLLTFVTMKLGRYLPPQDLIPFLKQLPKSVHQEQLGTSVRGLPIHLWTLGSGTIKIFMWSQMHGNESTTTRALLKLIPWLLEKENKHLLTACQFHIIPQLNPDGCLDYTRRNANTVDLNRDAVALSQPESKVLRSAYKRIAPDYCLNLHDQRTLYGAGKNGPPASVSFLAPSADPQRSITPARATAMKLIAQMNEMLQTRIPKQVGRYDDGFNINCVGDTFTALGTPTILFESGHCPGDYFREETSTHIFTALKTLVQAVATGVSKGSVEDYLAIPENSTDYLDLIIDGVQLNDRGLIKENQQLGLQYLEKLDAEKLHFIPTYHCYGDSLKQQAHRKIKLPEELRHVVFEFEFEKMVENLSFNELFSIKEE